MNAYSVIYSMARVHSNISCYINTADWGHNRIKTAVITRAVPDLFFPIRPKPDFAGFGMTNPAGTRAGFSNRM